jgi:hypothetical protein
MYGFLLSKGKFMNCPNCGSKRLWNKGYSHGNRSRKRFLCRECNESIVVKVETQVIIPVKEKIVTWRDLTRIAKDHQQIRRDMDFTSVEAKVHIDTKQDGIVVLPLSDLHVGAEGVDYLALEAITDFIKTNKIYVILAGDELDTFFANFKNATALFQQILNPEEQMAFIESWLEEIEPWIIALGWGNHTEKRLESLLGINFYGKMKSKVAPYMDGIGKILLNVNEQKYDIVINHRGTGRSKYNANYGAFDLARNKVDGDLFITGHYHEAAFSNFLIRDKPVVAIQTGTFNSWDKFAMRGFRFGESKVILPAVFISAKEKKIIPFDSVEDALKFRG